MAETGQASALKEIPEQKSVPWAVAFTVSWGSIRRRMLRSLITMAGIVLAIAFLTYMLTTGGLTGSLVAANIDELNVLLQKAGVDIFAPDRANRMQFLLIGLSLLASLVGIINAMLMSVSERIKEIGTLKCLGALDSFIVKTYLIESTLQGVVGTLIGAGIGLVVALGISLVDYGGYVAKFFPAAEVARSLAVAVLVGSGLSVAASIWPAYMAARKQPVDAMRIEE